jgi:F-type H+-transporting ATPase subunit c
MAPVLAQVAPAATNLAPLAVGIAVLGAALAVGLIGFRTVESVGRNPQAQGKIFPLALVLGAFAEGLGILAIFFIK